MPRDLLEQPRPTGAGPDGVEPTVDPWDETNVTEEEQGQYDQFVTKALRFIHHPQSRDKIIDHMNDKNVSVPEAVGRTAAVVVETVVNHAKASGVDISGDAVFHAGTEIVQELMEVGARAGIFPIKWPEDESDLPQEIDYMLEQAFAIGVHEYGKKMTATEEGKALADEAQNFYATQVAKEADAGQLDPTFAGQQERNQVQPGGNRQLLEEEPEPAPMVPEEQPDA